MKLAIVGAGLYAEALIAYLGEHSHLAPKVVLDDDETLHDSRVHDVPVIGATDRLPAIREFGIEAVLVAIGSNASRLRLNRRARQLGFRTPGFIHPFSSVSSSSPLDNGVIVLDGAVVQPFVTIGESVIIGSNATVAHHSVLKEGVLLAAGVTVGASITLEAMTTVGVGASVMTGVRNVGAGATIGAGAVVIRDVSANTTVVGVPARLPHVKTETA
jgi:sugar O-acyltransferase (sialic acid O-acetyltransferase NeuD family)